MASEPVYFSDGIDPVCRSSDKELFLVTIEAKPNHGSGEYEEKGGAFVNCWINAVDLRTAERRAVALIQSAGWTPYRIEEWAIVTRETYANIHADDTDDLDTRELIEQAFIVGEIAVFNTWPQDAPDGDDAFYEGVRVKSENEDYQN